MRLARPPSTGASLAKDGARLAARILATLAFYSLAVGPAVSQGGQATVPSRRMDASPQQQFALDFLPERRGAAPNLPPIEPSAPSRPSIPTLPVQPRAGGEYSPDAPRFLLRGVKVIGSSVLDEQSVQQVAARFLGRPVGVQDLEEIRRQVTLLYVERGYVNSGAVIPDQTIADGFLIVQVVEGELTQIELTGNYYYRSSYLADRLRQGFAVPFNVNDLALQQQILLQDPFLRRLNLSIEPGLVPGEARLSGEVTEASPYSLTAQVANNQSPTVGGVRGQLQGVVGNLLGVGDSLALQYGRGQGLDDGAVSYSLPISSDDTRVSLRYDVNSTLVVAQNLAPLGITSQYQSIGFGLSRPLYRTAEQALTLGLSLEWRQSRTFLLGEPFSFVAGSDNGRTNVTALRFYQDWLDRNSERVAALRSTFSVGINALGATVTHTAPTTQFLAWLGQAQYIRRFYQDWEVLARGSLQLSNDPLFPIEQFVLGGISTVRGYREYLTATDNAFAGTVELRVPIGKLSLPLLNTVDDGAVQLVPFYDHGVGWNTRQPTPKVSDLSSVGLGLRWFVGFGIAAEVYYGYALNPVSSGNTLQDHGLHFRVTTSLF